MCSQARAQEKEESGEEADSETDSDGQRRQGQPDAGSGIDRNLHHSRGLLDDHFRAARARRDACARAGVARRARLPRAAGHARRGRGTPQAPRGAGGRALRAVLLQAYLARIVHAARELRRRSARSRASARWRAPWPARSAAAGLPAVSSLLHANARLEGELEPRLLALLDGTRDRQALVESLSGASSRRRASRRRHSWRRPGGDSARATRLAGAAARLRVGPAVAMICRSGLTAGMTLLSGSSRAREPPRRVGGRRGRPSRLTQ